MGNYEEGLAVRREVLGTDYVDRSLQSADDFTAPLQELITEYCWGEIWTRDDLPRATRSLINIAMMTALNRPHELRLHVRGALTNGCSVKEIRGVLLQTVVYCGVPAALDAFRVAREVIQESNGEAS
jgi:4-carboxymuconolactone decarboxylase